MSGEQTAGFIRPRKENTGTNPILGMPALFEAALTEFSEKSFGAASLNDIIRNGGLCKGSFYHRFSDKLDLYLCMIDAVARKKQAFFEQRSRADGPTGDFFEQIRTVVSQGIEFSLVEPRYYAFWRLHLSEPADIREAVRATFPDRAAEVLEAMIEKAREEGRFRADFPPGFVGGILKLLILHIDTLIQPGMDEEDIALLCDHLVEMLKYGLK